jgi:flavin-dependent dehydrogenase
VRQERGTDVVITGGGPAGAAAAITLIDAGYSVTIIDRGRADRERIGETLPAAVRPLLSSLGVWHEFERAGHPSTERVRSSWFGAELEWRDAISQPLGPGWQLDRARFDAMLLDEAERRGATVLRGATVVDVLRGGSAVTGVLAADGDGVSPRSLASSFVVDCSGRTASVARRCGSPRFRADRLTCVFGRLDLPADPPPTDMIVEAVPEGWWYAAPASDGTGIAALFTDPDILRSRSAALPGGWFSLLTRTRHAYDLLGKPPVPDAVVPRSAASLCRLRVYGDGWVAAGDAATAWDPLTSAGVVTALRSGMETGAAVDAALAGDDRALVAYEREVKERFTRYLLERRRYYAGMGRWQRSPFWSRRSRRAGAAISSVGSRESR